MKKIILLISSFVLIISLSINVFAMDISVRTLIGETSTLNEDNNQGNVEMEIVVAPTYTVTIPETVTLDETATIKAENVLTEANKAVKVAITGTDKDGNFQVTSDDNTKIDYEIKKGSAVMGIGEGILFEEDGNVSLSFDRIETEQVFAGTYTGTVTFTVSYEDIN